MSETEVTRFFTLNQGKACGPFPKDKILEEIKGGKISAFDLIYREHDEKWLPAHQIGDFLDFFKKVPVGVEELDWVVLRLVDDEGGRRYLQEGPYTTALVKERLSDGRLSYRDFIWQKEGVGWKRIAAHEQFNPSAPSWSATHQLLEDALDELAHEFEELKGVEEFRFQKSPPPEPQAIPPEAQALIEESQVKPKPIVRARTSAPFAASPTWPEENQKRFLKWGVIGLLLCGLAAATYVFAPPIFLGEANSPEPEVQAESPIVPKAEDQKKVQEASEPIPELPQVNQEAPKPPPAEKPEMKKEPTWLKVKALKGGGLIFTSDASSHYPVDLLVFGRAGDILDQVSVVKSVKVRWKRDEKRLWRADNAGFPQGLYQFRASIGSVETKGTFRVGQRNKSFRERLSRHRKLISLPFQREKRGLLIVLEDLEDQLSKNVNASQLKKWTIRNLKQVGPKNADQFVFPEVWMSVSEQVAQFSLGKLSSSDLQRYVREERVQLEKRKLFTD